jgi:hypothetical protein
MRMKAFHARVGPLLFLSLETQRVGSGAASTVTCWYEAETKEHTETGEAHTLRTKVYSNSVRLDKGPALHAYAKAVLQECETRKITLSKEVTEDAIVRVLADGYESQDPDALAPDQLAVKPEELSADKRFAIIDGQLYAVLVDKQDHILYRDLLMNAAAKITADMVLDDGDETRVHHIEVSVVLRDRTYTARLPIALARGPALIGRLMEATGSRLSVAPSVSSKVLYHAIQAFGAPDVQTVRTHTGWVFDEQGVLHFLDNEKDVLWTDLAGERPPVSVWLPKRSILRRYRLRQGLDSAKGWAALEQCLAVAPRTVTLPLCAAALLPPVHPFLETPTRVLPFLVGLTGRRKSALARLFCCLWGDFLGEGALLRWTSTPTIKETMAHTLKDVLLIVDDYKKKTVDVAEAVEFIQQYSDSEGKDRSSPDLSPRPSQAARCIVLATGENYPLLEPSVLARLLFLPVGPHDLDLVALDRAQENARALGSVTIGFLRWLAAAEDVRTHLPKNFIARLAVRTAREREGRRC